MSRPLAVAGIGWLYIVVGVAGLGHDVLAMRGAVFSWSDGWAIPLVHLAAVIAGAYLLRGKDWARWLAIAWIGFHVVFSFNLSPHPGPFVTHLIIFLLLAWGLFRPSSTQYFRAAA